MSTPNDLTVIFLTANRVPAGWVEYQRGVLLDAIGDLPLIVVSARPEPWAPRNLIQDGYGVRNLFSQMMRASEIAGTEYVAFAEDDTLYPPDHFGQRPPAGKHFAYNLNRWQAFTWARHPFYFHKPRPANGCLIARREAVVQSIERRLASGREFEGDVAEELGKCHLDVGQMSEFYGAEPVVSLVHPESVDNLAQRRRKWPWPVQAYDIPRWRKAKWVVGHWKP